jgi:iron-sulfur cluster repair protein YtfE (RIC family)
MAATEPLRQEHRALLPHIDQILATADAIGAVPIARSRRAVGAVHAFLVEHLLPHARAEDAVLYPLVGKLMGAPEATATMRRDHVEVGRLTDELGRLLARLDAGVDSAEVERNLRRVLYGLHAVVTLHFAKEEEVYLPLLDARLSADEADDLFMAMARAASDGRREQAGH